MLMIETLRPMYQNFSGQCWDQSHIQIWRINLKILILWYPFEKKNILSSLNQISKMRTYPPFCSCLVEIKDVVTMNSFMNIYLDNTLHNYLIKILLVGITFCPQKPSHYTFHPCLSALPYKHEIASSISLWISALLPTHFAHVQLKY